MVFIVLNKGQEIYLFVEVNERITIIDNTLNADEAVNPRAHLLTYWERRIGQVDK